MVFYKTLFTIIAISTFYLINYAHALSKEAIVGGFEGGSEYLTYQVLIQGLKNHSSVYFNLGGGVIISERYILSAASIFMETTIDLKPYRFSILLGSNDLNSSSIFRRNISYVFIVHTDATFLFFNLALAQLTKGIGLLRKPHVSKVRLPDPDDSFEYTMAVASGFGYFETKMDYEPLTRFPIVTDGNYSTVLRYKKVAILSDDDCGNIYNKYETITNMCGLMSSIHQGEAAGICEGDIGGPLVSEGDLLIGIASRTTPDCDNTIKPAAYFKVTSLIYNIQSFLGEGYLGHKGLIRYNRIHIQPVINQHTR